MGTHDGSMRSSSGCAIAISTQGLRADGRSLAPEADLATLTVTAELARSEVAGKDGLGDQMRRVGIADELERIESPIIKRRK